MKSVNQFLLIIFCLLLIVGCKSVFTKTAESTPIVTQKVLPSFEYLETESDAALAEHFLDYKIKKYTIDSIGNDYISAKVFYPKDSTFKVINLYGEYVGATYNPTSESHIIYKNKLLDSVIYGETYRIDKLSNNVYLFYTDNFDRLASNFDYYKVSFFNDSISIEKAEKHGNIFFDFINNCKESPDKFPKNINALFPVNPNLPANDTASTFFDGNYYPEEDFMSKNTRDFFTQLFYRKKFGDQIEKVVQIHNYDSISEITLAMIGGDSDSYSLSSEFVNDSIFTQTLVTRETIKDEANLMGYAFDSIITTFKYNDTFKLDTISKDTFRYEKEYFKRYDKPVENHIFYSNTFKINNLSCFWQTTIEIHFDDNGKPLQGKNITRILINKQTKKPILVSMPNVIVHNETDFFDPLLDNFKDYNFDGYVDFSMYNFISSGATHAFFDNYLYNPKTKKFDYDRKSAGAEITVDEKLKTVTFYQNLGRIYHNETIQYYNQKGTIMYEESISEEEQKEKNSDTYFIKKTYTKKVNGKIVKKSVSKENR